MKKLLLLTVFIGVAASGPKFTHPAQSPKDVVVNGARKPRLIAPPVAPVSPALVPQFTGTTNTNHPPCWPNCTNYSTNPPVIGETVPFYFPWVSNAVWAVQVSTNLTDWVTVTNQTNPVPWRSLWLTNVYSKTGPQMFYRAIRVK